MFVRKATFSDFSKASSHRFLLLYLTTTVGLSSAETKGQNGPVVQISSGSIRGRIQPILHGKSVQQFLNIPYAEAPLGGFRFAAPVPVKPWTEVKDATKPAPRCAQKWPAGLSNRKVPYSEDCLVLNVYKPVTDNLIQGGGLPVMVFIHGGAYTFGSSSEFDSSVLAAFNDVIVVTINYRLGVFGFLYAPGTDVKGNTGMLDQVEALKWVQTNILSFEGDPKRVTIFGESAGSMSVSLHLVSPLSAGLFQRAILESGSSMSSFCCHKIRSLDALERFAALINCPFGDEFLGCLRRKTADELLDTQDEFEWPPYEGERDVFVPTVDGDFLPDEVRQLLSQGKVNDVDVIIGFNKDEASMFASMMNTSQFVNGTTRTFFKQYVANARLTHDDTPLIRDLALHVYTDHNDPDSPLRNRANWLQLMGDVIFYAPIVEEAQLLAKKGATVYMYELEYEPAHTVFPKELFGSFHTMELFFVFGAPFDRMSVKYRFFLKFTNIEKGLSLFMMKMWTNFAKYGNPNEIEDGFDLVMWPKFTNLEQEYLAIDLQSKVKRRFRADKMAFWNTVVPKLTKASSGQHAGGGTSGPRDEL